MTEVNIVTGYKGAGKTTVLEIINIFGFYTTELSEQWKYLEVLGFNRDEKNGEWSTGVISLVYETLLKRISMTPIFMSGFSRPVEIKFLQEREFCCKVIEVMADSSVRYQRIIKRNKEGEGELSIGELNERDLRRLGQVNGYRTNDLDGLLSLASYRIDNNGNIRDLAKQVKRMLENKGYLK